MLIVGISLNHVEDKYLGHTRTLITGTNSLRNLQGEHRHLGCTMELILGTTSLRDLQGIEGSRSPTAHKAGSRHQGLITVELMAMDIMDVANPLSHLLLAMEILVDVTSLVKTGIREDVVTLTKTEAPVDMITPVETDILPPDR